MTKRGPNAPNHLSEEARRLWRSVTGEFEMEVHDLARLQVACEALDRMREAQAVLRELGTTYIAANGSPRARPECRIESDSRLAFLRALRECGLDGAEIETAARPPGRR